jgi:uncharacterized protein YdaU (DUF1376 family)
MEGRPVKYWARWIEKIRKRTATLSMAQMGAYDRLLDHYYETEQPVPADLDGCCRICGATSLQDRRDVKAVLARFFVLDGDCYTHQKVEEEIAWAQPRIEAARRNGAKGGRPKGSKTTRPAPEIGAQKNPLGFQWEPDENPDRNTHNPIPRTTPIGEPRKCEPRAPMPASVSAQAPAHTREPEAGPPGEDPPPDESPGWRGFDGDDDEPLPAATPYGAMCLQIRRRTGFMAVASGHQTFRALVDQGADAEEFCEAARQAVKNGKGWPWVLATVQGRRRDAAAMKLAPKHTSSTTHDLSAMDYAAKGLPDDIPSDLPPFAVN